MNQKTFLYPEVIHKLRLLYLLLAILVIFSTLGTTIVQAAIPASERAVLLALYNNTNGVSWNNNTAWNGAAGTECNWYGITCDAGASTVTGINLHGNNLAGPLPTNLNNLTNLQNFTVYTNYISGPIPSLAGLTYLQTFQAYQNALSGTIPSLTGMTNLQTFIVSNNQLSGSIPSLAGLTNLQTFQVNINSISGPIPSLTGLTNLQSFFVNNNHLTGNVPSLPSPNVLYNSSLCPNYLNKTANSAWDAATGVTPWYTNCTPAITTYNVTYYGNGNTGGAVPIDGNAYASGASINVLGNAGNLVNSGYSFTGWNTVANGTGTSYSVGATFPIVSNVELYAQWTTTTLSLNININGNGTITNTNSSGPTLSCNASNCSNRFNSGSLFTLTATPSASYSFNGLSGTGSASSCSGTGSCSFTLNTDTTVNAAFTTLLPVMIHGVTDTYFQTLTQAYNSTASVNSITIEAQSAVFKENLTLDSNINVSLLGGYDGSFSTQSGMTTLNGVLTIGHASLVADNLIIAGASTLVSIAVTPTNSTLTQNSTRQFTAIGTCFDNSTQNLTSLVAWSSSNTPIAIIAAGGIQQNH